MAYDIMGDEYDLEGEIDIMGDDDETLAGLIDIMGGDDDDSASGLALAMGDELSELLSAAAGRRGRGRGRSRGRGRGGNPRAAAQAMLRAMQNRGLPGGVRRMAAAERLARSGVLVSERHPNRSREYVVGFDSVVAVAGGALFTAVQTPQVVFRPERLIIPSDIAGLFLVANVLIGKNPAFAAAGAVPARTFSELGVGVRLQCDTVQPGMSIALQVQNISAAPARFTASFIGSAVE